MKTCFYPLLLLSFSMSMIVGCSQAVFDQMGKAEQERNQRIKKELLMAMSIQDMFSDPAIRALANATADGNLKEIDRLVAQGSNVNAKGAYGVTVLFVGLRHYAAFQRLLELGADPNVVYSDGDGSSVLHWVVLARDDRFLQAALGQKGDPNFVYDRRRDPLLFEAINVSDSRVDMLLNAGANINARNANGDTAATFAAGIADFGSVYHLLQRGIDSRVRDNYGDDLRKLTTHFGELVDSKSKNGLQIKRIRDYLAAEDRKQEGAARP